ncbi:MAG: DNA translocase FtsK 4TM domain-containing protein [Candidatus Accumulibacter sp.]|uniref:DNA translocase FtsK n=1 Tax=Accumulibacter sp. TaxID=2053492 RepID=UPI002879DAF0|nr:DNA translocase FtsK 4TM domain-containing protein [Accumulibacter sp.]MDS4014569.1 DNA translocase FtsK 4TM domain-containing protein [Accumulibacter sp.]
MAFFNRLTGKTSSSSRAASNPLPEKIALLLQESRWLILIVIAGFLALSLWGYHRADPGWSHAVHALTLHNPAGRSGAWLADLLLAIFGLSAWWWIVLLLAFVWWGYRSLDGRQTGDRRPLLIALSGFLVLLGASSGLETLRFYTHSAPLPVGPGGILGLEVGAFAVRYLGYTGATLTLFALLVLGWSIFTGMSWITAAERCGTLLEQGVLALRDLLDRWRDRRIGREIAREREAVVEVEKRRVETHEPVLIETPPEISAPPPLPPKVEKRIERERQAVLFPEAVVGGMLPPLHLLEPAPLHTDSVSHETLEYTSRLIERKLADFGVQVTVTAAYPGPVITRYEIEPAVGVKGAQILNLAKDLARSLSLVSVRVVETVPGKSSMALELPNPKRQTVRLLEIISSRQYSDLNAPLAMTLGKDIGGQPVVVDLARMPHLLVAGTTGSGKSVGINAMILSLLYKSEPDLVRLILVDPKMLELSIYEGIPHLLAPVVVDMKQASNALNWCVAEMEKRYKLMSAMGVRNVSGFNHRVREAEKAGEKIPNPLSLTPETPEPLAVLPYIVVVIDELADLMMVSGKTVEQLIARLAQKARASGIHLILATQRPSVDVITGLIKANIPTRISFQVSSKIDSRTILDQMGAEALLGQGDMLFLAPGTGYPTRVHGAFVADDEVHRVVDYLKKVGTPNYVDGVLSGGDEGGTGASGGEGGGSETDGEADPVYDQAVEVVLKNRRASISLVQRHLRIGYNRSARLLEAMEKAGLVSAMDPRGGREVIARKEDE